MRVAGLVETTFVGAGRGRGAWARARGVGAGAGRGAGLTGAGRGNARGQCGQRRVGRARAARGQRARASSRWNGQKASSRARWRYSRAWRGERKKKNAQAARQACQWRAPGQVVLSCSTRVGRGRAWVGRGCAQGWRRPKAGVSDARSARGVEAARAGLPQRAPGEHVELQHPTPTHGDRPRRQPTPTTQADHPGQRPRRFGARGQRGPKRRPQRATDRVAAARTAARSSTSLKAGAPDATHAGVSEDPPRRTLQLAGQERNGRGSWAAAALGTGIMKRFG